MKNTIKLLPKIEQQVLKLVYWKHLKQEDVAARLHMTQENVSYIKKRALTRIQILRCLNKVNLNAMRLFLSYYLTNKQTIAMTEYFIHHDLRKIAKTIKGRVRKKIAYEAIGSRIKLGMKQLKKLKLHPDKSVRHNANIYVKVFYILKKYNSIRGSQYKNDQQRINSTVS